MLVDKQTARRGGFTIVELLIVIVVIAILAAITIVAYGGVSQKARESLLQSDLRQSAQKLELARIDSGVYPTSLDAAGISGAEESTYTYQRSDAAFCLSVMGSGTSYRVQNSEPTVRKGSCSGVLIGGGVCPDGYVVVPGSVSFGTADFCIMKYEAKIQGVNDGSTTYAASMVAESRPSGTPWVNITRANAATKAAASCAGCHLLTEAERMTVAANILSVPSNWSGGAVGSGYVYSGHNDNAPSRALAASANDSEGYAETGNGATETALTNGVQGRAQRRTLQLTNGEVIWDFAGNVWEFTTGTISGGNPGTVGWAWFEYPAITNWANLSPSSRPSAISTTVAGYSSAQGIGRLYTNSAETGSMMFVRGGFFQGGVNAGVLALSINASVDHPVGAFSSTGFRAAR